MRLSDYRMVVKMAACLAVLGIAIGAAVFYAASQMRAIDANYSDILENDAAAAVHMARAATRINTLNGWIYKFAVVKDAEARRQIDEKLQVTMKEFDHYISATRARKPAYRDQVEAISQRVWSLVNNQYAALKAAAEANDPNKLDLAFAF
ncbi:MAG: hypothetical protein EKK41_00705, partial [Hyphomicrobiales bacterium]